MPPTLITTEASMAQIQVPEFYPCQGYDHTQHPLSPNTIFEDNVDEIYICGFLDPKSTELRYAGPDLYLGVDWKHQSDDLFPFWEQDYYQVSAGWFYPVLKAPPEGYPIGTYNVKLYAGKNVEASTTFEVVPAE